ncbi:hypothetical protein DYQ94_08210 [Xanthomonas sp. LMG 8993]|nr:hypothetical protein [Xanthomonas sp. LMG 8993]
MVAVCCEDDVGLGESGIGNRDSGSGIREAGSGHTLLAVGAACFKAMGAGGLGRTQPSRRTSFTPGKASSLPSRLDSWS